MAQTKLSAKPPEFEFVDPAVQSVRYLEHGYPSELVRWHYHDNYELHYIVESNGKVFVGDYFGDFESGQTILTGPCLPHNWISDTADGEVIELRDRVVQFGQTFVQNLAAIAPEVNQLIPLLERARFGIEFQGEAQSVAGDYMRQIGASQGVKRVSTLLEFLDILAGESHYNLLSTLPIGANADDAAMVKINRVVDHVMQNFKSDLTLAEVAELIGMSETAFSRFYKQATGCGFNKFVNRVRISHACELLAQSNMPITRICFETGFHNVANFNRQFLKVKHITPREYRVQIRNRAG